MIGEPIKNTGKLALRITLSVAPCSLSASPALCENLTLKTLKPWARHAFKPQKGCRCRVTSVALTDALCGNGRYLSSSVGKTRREACIERWPPPGDVTEARPASVQSPEWWIESKNLYISDLVVACFCTALLLSATAVFCVRVADVLVHKLHWCALYPVDPC